jgi:SNF2 family DNA or RNA helicase
VRRFYEELKKDFVAQIDAGEVSVSTAMTLSTRLRQATGGQTAIDGVGRRIDPAVCDKRAVLEDLLSDLDEPVVIFANFVCDMEEIAAACRSIGKSFSELSGRKKELKQWQDGDTDVIGVQIQAGGAGVDLSRSRVAIYYSPTWSLGDYDQSLARIRRPGQKAKSCLYLHLVAVNTIDGVMHKALQGKRRVVDAVIEGLASPVTV